MGSSVIVRDIDPGDKSWLRRQARQTGVSMEELVRRLIREKRTKTERRPKPSEAFARHFGEDHGVELPPPIRCGYQPLSFSGEE
ncbi:MAG: toxin-antitoxin system [Gemmatimonadota bacterium]|nr:toxin-antitoxin system [Gemmatimonadota bacterium]